MLVSSGDRGGAAEAFLRLTGMPDGIVAMIQGSPGWSHMLGLAHTLSYDLAVTGDATVPAERFSKITIPSLVACGASSPEEMRNGAVAVAAALPAAQHVTCEGQGHAIDHAVIAPMLIDFFTAVRNEAR